MTRPILHRQSGSWTNIASYAPAKPDLYASLAAVTLPDSGNISRRGPNRARSTPFRGTVARKATDLFNAIGRCLTARAATPSGLSQSTLASCQHRIAIAIDALMWAVFAGCFVLLASGAL